MPRSKCSHCGNEWKHCKCDELRADNKRYIKRIKQEREGKRARALSEASEIRAEIKEAHNKATPASLQKASELQPRLEKLLAIADKYDDKSRGELNETNH